MIWDEKLENKGDIDIFLDWYYIEKTALFDGCINIK